MMALSWDLEANVASRSRGCAPNPAFSSPQEGHLHINEDLGHFLGLRGASLLQPLGPKMRFRIAFWGAIIIHDCPILGS